MTTFTTVIALLPVITASGRGADVARAMAIPVFGDMVVELITLFVVPVVYWGSPNSSFTPGCEIFFFRWRLCRRPSEPPPPDPPFIQGANMLLRLSVLLICVSTVAGCQPSVNVTRPDPEEQQTGTVALIDQVVEASCGECQFGMPGSGCDLAIRVNGQSYYVDGSSIDDHGNAHGDDGLCNCIRQARVNGEIRDDRFVSTSFELLPADNLPENNDSAN